MLVALLCPLALFKLLAFLDPNTVSGGATRGFMSGGSGQSFAPVGAASAGQGGEAATESRFGSQLSGAAMAGAAVADAASERGGQILDTAGVGHQGVSTGSSRGRGQGSPGDAGGQGGEPDWTSSDGPDGTTGGWVPEPVTPPTPVGPAGGGAAASGSGAAAGSGATAAEMAVVAL